MHSLIEPKEQERRLVERVIFMCVILYKCTSVYCDQFKRLVKNASRQLLLLRQICNDPLP